MYATEEQRGDTQNGPGPMQVTAETSVGCVAPLARTLSTVPARRVLPAEVSASNAVREVL